VPDLKIVISSTWRIGKSLGWLQDHFENEGFSYATSMIDVTPDLQYSSTRGAEICVWLNEHPEVTEFVILDDDSDMGDLISRLVKTESRIGLTEKNADSVIELFSGEILRTPCSERSEGQG